MLLKLKRSQKTVLGQLRAGVVYEFNMKDSRHKAVAESLVDRGMAERTSRKEIDAADSLAREKALVADGSEGTPMRSAIGNDPAIKAQEQAKADAKAAAEAKADAAVKEKAEADAKAKAEAKADAAAKEKAEADAKKDTDGGAKK